MFSIIIPTLNNLKYLKTCINSIKKNSKYNHEIICHVNIGNDGTKEYLEKEKIKYTFTNYNAGICAGMNLAVKKSNFKYILYSHDDFYFCPNWDTVLMNEVNKIGHKNFYLSGIMMNNGPIKFNSGDNIEEFDEKKLLNNFNNYNHYDFQGSTWAPHLIHREIWDKVGGFSEEFYPGTGSDPDLNMKLWQIGIRIFKGLNSCKVYHFGSIVTRKFQNNKNIITESGSKGGKIFLLKWRITIKFFKEFYLNSDQKYNGPLLNPKITAKYLFQLLMCKLYYIYILLTYKKNGKLKSN